MSEIEAEKLLQKIASQPKKKAAARIRDMFDALEAALAVKTIEEVFKELEPIKLGITVTTFGVTIRRIRKERRIAKSSEKALDQNSKETKTTPAAQAPAPAPTTKTATTQQLVENESGVFEPSVASTQEPEPKTEPKKLEEPTGIVDIFSIQAEREEEKKRNPPKRTIRRLT